MFEFIKQVVHYYVLVDHWLKKVYHKKINQP